jgi:hypothetical protein
LSKAESSLDAISKLGDPKPEEINYPMTCRPVVAGNPPAKDLALFVPGLGEQGVDVLKVQ